MTNKINTEIYAKSIIDTINAVILKSGNKYVNDETKELLIKKYLDKIIYQNNVQVKREIRKYFKNKHKWVEKKIVQADIMDILDCSIEDKEE